MPTDRGKPADINPVENIIVPFEPATATAQELQAVILRGSGNRQLEPEIVRTVVHRAFEDGGTVNVFDGIRSALHAREYPRARGSEERFDLAAKTLQPLFDVEDASRRAGYQATAAAAREAKKQSGKMLGML